jgi:uncharacterized protein RhaS with RHS repeats
MSKDPIGFDGGDVNLYGYVLNDPVNKFINSPDYMKVGSTLYRILKDHLGSPRLVYDPDLKLVHFGARDYDASTER